MKKKSKGLVHYIPEKNPDGTFNVLKVKQYFSIASMSMTEVDAKSLIKLLEKQNISIDEKL